MNRKKYLLCLGGNVGNTEQTFAAVAAQINAQEEIHLIVASEIWSSPAYGSRTEHTFSNQLLIIECYLSPESLLFFVKKIESGLGRLPAKRWGNRIIDIDIVDSTGLEVDVAYLSIPHRSISRPYLADQIQIIWKQIDQTE